MDIFFIDHHSTIAHGAHFQGYNREGLNKDPYGNVVDLMVWGETNNVNDGVDLTNANGGMKVYI